MRAGYRAAARLKLPERRRRNRRALLALFLLAAAAGAVARLATPAARVLGRIPFFQAGRVEVTGLTYLTVDEVRPSIPVRDGESFFAIKPAEIVRSLTRNPRIESASVHFMPAEVQIAVRERRPFVLVSAGTLLEVDSSGTVLPPLTRGLIADRPVVSGLRLGTRRPGSKVSTARFAEIRAIVRRLEAPEVDLLSEISEIVADDPRWLTLRTSRDQIPILVDPARTTQRSLRALKAALRDLRERDRQVLGVDARFRGQVIVRCAPDSVDMVPAARDKV